MSKSQRLSRGSAVPNPFILIALLIAVVIGLSFITRSALAATVWNVSVGSLGACNVGDPNCATITDAVNASSPGDTINVAAGTYNEHDIIIVHDLIINGAGPATTIVDAQQLGRVFFMIGGGTIAITGLRITNGKTADGADGAFPEDADPGGGILLFDGALTLTNCLINNNRTGNGGNGNMDDTYGGFGGPGGGIFVSSFGSLTMTGCTVSNNATGKSGQSGNGWFSGWGGDGGGIYNDGLLSIDNCTISNNSTGEGTGGAPNNENGGSGGNGGGIYTCGFTGPTTISNSTISNNTAGKGGTSINSGYGGEGGGIFNENDIELIITNSTINNNRTGDAGGQFSAAGRGGGLWSYGPFTMRNSTVAFNATGDGGPDAVGGDGGGIHSEAFDTITITNSTIVGNRTGNSDVCGCGSNGGGVHLFFFGFEGVFKSVIIANNTVGTHGNGPDVFGDQYISEGYNLVGKTDGSSGFPGFTEPTDQTGTIATPLDPKMDPAGLQANGGPTRTIKPQGNSPALDKGISNGLTTDQRGPGFPRTFDSLFANAAGGDGTDVGAFEVLATSCAPDLVPPTITCPTGITKYTDSGQLGALVNPGVPIVKDNCSVQIVATRSDGKPLNELFKVGLTIITWRATDPGGRTATCGQPIIVMAPSSRKVAP